MQTDIVPVEVQTRAAEIEIFAEGYENYSITTVDRYQAAASDLQVIKSKAKELETTRKGITEPMDKAKKKVMDFFRRPLEILEKAESAIKSAMVNFQAEQERIRQAEQERLNEMARKEEQKKREEKERQEREWRAKEEAKRKEAEKLAAQGKAEAAAKARAEADKAAEKAAERARQAADIQVVAPMVAKQEVSAAGIKMRENWKFRVVNANLIPRELMIPDERKLGEIARANKSLAKVDGVEFYREDIIAASAR